MSHDGAFHLGLHCLPKYTSGVTVSERVQAFKPLDKSTYQKNNFLILSTKTYVVGTQKNRLIETGLLSTQNICQELWVRKYLQFYAANLCLSKPVAFFLKFIALRMAKTPQCLDCSEYNSAKTKI